MEYEFTVREVREVVKYVSADSRQDALKDLREMYESGEYDVDGESPVECQVEDADGEWRCFYGDCEEDVEEIEEYVIDESGEDYDDGYDGDSDDEEDEDY